MNAASVLAQCSGQALGPDRVIWGGVRVATRDSEAVAGCLVVAQFSGWSSALSCWFFPQCHHSKYPGTDIYVAVEWNSLVYETDTAAK